APYNKQYITISGLAFQHQKVAGFYCDGAHQITVTGCTFRDLSSAIRSAGNGCAYLSNVIQRTYATAICVFGNTCEVVGNQLSDIAMEPGLGESAWGYQGIYAVGTANGIRSNQLTNIGYSGIFVEGSPTVERNVIRNAVAILNDGGGIHYDNTDGMVVQDNIVLDLLGSLESSASNGTVYWKICHGIYFGNVSIRNSTIQRNTVSNCRGGGIHYDHTMVSSGNQVKDNILFNNEIQLSISDFSNSNGPGATLPFHVASYNDVISGNTMYCLSRDQLCMKQFNCYSPNTVDFGTFSNNKYYNPYTELSIFYHNINSGVQRYFTLERLQFERGEDGGSSRSPLRLESCSTTGELSGNLVQNGAFISSVSGWAGWPTNGVVTRDLTYLDAGSLKAYLPNSSQYTEFLLHNPDLFSVQSGQWYRLRFSVQSNIHGIMRAGVKGATQMSGPNVVHERGIPFDTQRRDMEIYFQSGLTDQAMVQFVNSYTEPQYWLDNVDLRRVTVQAIDPTQEHLLFYNDQATPQSFVPPAGCWSDMNGTVLSAPVSVEPYSSIIVYRVPGTGCSVTQAYTVGARVFLGGAMNWGSGLMRDNLRQQGLIPATEPYSAMGISLENPGASLTGSLLLATGAQAIVDWVVLELRNNDAGYTVAGRRAALLRANGDVIAVDGSAQIPFNVPAMDKYLVVRHRNHLSAMASTPIASNGQTVDMTSGVLSMYGTEPLQLIGSERGLWPGESSMDGTVRYTGTDNDRDPVLVAIGASIPSNVVQGYSASDVNLDGWVKYTGSG
ncbi:MAG TPA: right-handed parallel beta-helix repeat-containing protein, partial [Flavobacteriales bacterium]|nr:right-handed parallel beta-helix repeat-containing protein [Flavobacteriales bacterium]